MPSSSVSTPPAKIPDSSAQAVQSYEAAWAELEALIARMESGQMPLEQLLQSYTRGAELLGYCRERLERVEQQIQVLEQGSLKPWDAGGQA